MSGPRPAWFDERQPGWLRRVALAPLRVASWAYAAGAVLTRLARQSRLLPRSRLACGVVSVGNLGVGGSAKTPLAAWVALGLRDEGLASAILSRGYGRREPGRTLLVAGARGGSGHPERSGDEPEWLGSKARGIPIWVSRRRVDAGRRSIMHFGTQVVVLDDGFQHTRLARDVDLVAVDATNGFGNHAVLPRGPLREPLPTLRHADAVVVVDGPLHPSDEAALSRWAPAARRVTARRVVKRLAALGKDSAAPPLSLSRLRGTPVGMLCGIAQPASLLRTLEALGARVQTERVFPDHHPYERRDLHGLGEQASLWVTTEKDALKIDPAWVDDAELWVLGVDLEVDDADAFRGWLVERLRAADQRR